MEVLHGSRYTYQMGCSCIPCVDANSCKELMYHRKRRSGGYYILHNGPESKYPEAMILWIKTKGLNKNLRELIRR